MTTWTECLEENCTAPSEAVGPMTSAAGVGREGQDIRVWWETRWCAAGHHYMVEVYEEDISDGYE
ncbi:MAG: hypothetical protein V4510_12765 [bacterium]